MTKTQTPKAPRSTLFYARENPKLRAQNPLHHKTKSLTREFELNRCPYNALQIADIGKPEAQLRRESIAYYDGMQRKQSNNEIIRGSDMVRRSQPKLILRPPLNVGPSIDRQTHMARLAQERREERRKQYQQNRKAEPDKTQENAPDMEAPPDKSLRKKLYVAARQTKTAPHHSHGDHSA